MKKKEIKKLKSIVGWKTMRTMKLAKRLKWPMESVLLITKKYI